MSRTPTCHPPPPPPPPPIMYVSSKTTTILPDIPWYNPPLCIYTYTLTNPKYKLRLYMNTGLRNSGELNTFVVCSERRKHE